MCVCVCVLVSVSVSVSVFVSVFVFVCVRACVFGHALSLPSSHTCSRIILDTKGPLNMGNL